METKRFHLLKPTSAWLWLLLLSSTALSQNPEFICGTFKNGSDPNRHYDYYDRFGNGYMENDLDLGNLNIQQNSCSLTEDFKLIFESGNGGFSTDEIETICDVFTYLSEIIEAPSGERATVRFKKDPNLDSDVVGTGTAYFSSHCRFGYSVVDIQLNLGGLSSNTQHASINVNTAISNFYIGPAGNIGPSQLDYYTVILHEALHTLGFASRISPSGDPVTNFYTPWDLNLRNPTGDYLILSIPGGGEPLCCADYKFNTDDFPGMPDIIWDQNCGTDNIRFDVAQLPPVNGEYLGQDPDDFLQVLSHLDRTCGTDHYVMNFNIPQGTDGLQRTLTASEISILCKLGYNVQGCDLTCIALAAKDGNFFVDLNETIDIDFSTLLSNDFPVDATLSYKPNCGSHSGLLIPNPVDDVFNITGLALGAYTFCYTITSCDGRICDETTVGVVVTNPAINLACQDLEPCQINKFWDFELFGSGAEMANDLALSTNPSTGANAFKLNDDPAFSNTPDFVTTPTNPNAGGCGNTFLESGNGTKRIRLYTTLQEDISKSEGIMFPLCETIFPGMKGQVTLRAMISNTCITAGYNPQIKVEFTESSPINNVNLYTNPGIDSPSYLESIVSSESTTPIYKTYTLPFQNDSDVCWNFMCLSGVLNGTFPGWLETYWYLDDVKVELSSNFLETFEVNTSVGQPTPCLEEVVTFEIEVCNNIACLPNTFSSPEFLVTGILPPGLNHVPNADFPSLSHPVLADEIPYGECITLELTAQVGSDPGLIGQPLPLSMSFDPATTSCINGTYFAVGSVTPMDCPAPFTCHCPANTDFYNVGTSMNSSNKLSMLNIPPFLENVCLNISGRLIVDETFTVSGSHFIMNRGAEIVLNVGTGLNLFGNTIEGCEHMWRGITVSGRLGAEDNQVYDAQWAIRAESGASIRVVSNVFDRNFAAFYTPEVSPNLNGLYTPKISGNTVTCTAPLLPPYTLVGNPNHQQIPEPGERTFAAAYLNDVAKTFDFQKDNEFDGLRNGIVANNSLFSMNQCTIKNLITYLYPQGQAPGVDFNFCLYGVRATDCANVNISSCEISGVHQGLRAERSNITVNNETHINADIPFSPSEPASTIPTAIKADFGTNRSATITGNTLASCGHGIDLNQWQPASKLLVSGNDISLATCNTSFNVAGIAMSFCRRGEVSANTVKPLIPSVAKGLSLGNCRDIFVNGNTFFDLFKGESGENNVNCYFLGNTAKSDTGNGSPDGTAGFGFINAFSDNPYCCNTVDGLSDVGFTFDGPSTGTSFTYSQIHGQPLGLLLTESADISPQSHARNRWFAGNTGAFHESDDQNFIPLSRFISVPALIPPFATAADQPGMPGVPWFVPQALLPGPPQPLCNCPYPQIGDLPRVTSEGDYLAAIGGYQLGQYSDAYNWMTQQRLYERLRQAPQLANTSSYIAAFYQSAENSPVDHFDALRQGVSDLIGRNNYTREQIGQSIEHLRILSEELRVLRQDPAATEQQQQNKADQLSQEVNLYRSYLMGVEQNQTNEIGALLNANASLSTYLVPQANEKTLNRVILENHLWEGSSLVAADATALHLIAAQCPLSGGFAVYQARGFLTALGADQNWNDAINCTPVSEGRGNERGQISGINVLTVYPNPANQIIMVSGFAPNGIEKTFEMYTTTGQKVLEISVKADQTSIDISTAGLKNGLYLYRSNTKDQSVSVGKIVVLH